MTIFQKFVGLLVLLVPCAQQLWSQTLTIAGHVTLREGKADLCDCALGQSGTMTIVLSKYIARGKREAEYPLTVAPVFSGRSALMFQENNLKLTVGREAWEADFGSTEGGYLSLINYGGAGGTFSGLDSMNIIISNRNDEKMAFMGVSISTARDSPIWNVTGAQIAPPHMGRAHFFIVSPQGDRAVFTVDTIAAAPIALQATDMTAIPRAPATIGSPTAPDVTSPAFMGNPSLFESQEEGDASALLRQLSESMGKKSPLVPLLAIELAAVLVLSGDTPNNNSPVEIIMRNLKKKQCDLPQPTLWFPFSKAPAIAAHIVWAQSKNENWLTLTKASRDEKTIRRRRTSACKETRKAIASDGKNGILSCDEYPFASALEGGENASTQAVPVGEQSIQGYIMMRFYSGFEDGVKKQEGTRFCVRVVE